MLDVTEGAKGFHVTVELPGVDESDVRVEARGNHLIVRGVKRELRDDGGERPFFRERAFGAFVRDVLLPGAVDGERILASFSRGVLTVALRKLAVPPDRAGAERAGVRDTAVPR